MNIFGLTISNYTLYSTIFAFVSIHLSAQCITAALHVRYEDYTKKWDLPLHQTQYANAYNFYELLVLSVLCFVPHVNIAIGIVAPMWFYSAYKLDVERMKLTTLGSAHDLKKLFLLCGMDQPREV
jgi:hypothetical protein